MPLINSIPERYEDGFRELGSLSELEFNKIEEGLSKAPLTSSVSKLGQVFSSIEELKLVDVDEIFSSVGSLIAFIEREEIIEEIVQDIVALCEDGELIAPENKKDFEKRLEILINNKQIYYAAKAEGLVNDYSNIYLLSRIVSDIRPVFDIHVDGDILGGLIVHNLNIHYQSHEEPFHKDISLTLTLEDLKTLREMLDRAEKKEASLKKVFEKSGMKHLNE